MLCYTTFVAIIIHTKSAGFPLNHLNNMSVLLVMWVPDFAIYSIVSRTIDSYKVSLTPRDQLLHTMRFSMKNADPLTKAPSRLSTS